MGTKIGKEKIKREPGYLYYLGKDGFVWAAPMGRVRPEHLVAVSIEASLEYLEPAAIFVSSVTGATARRLASAHLPVGIVAISRDEKTCQDLQFSYGVTAVHELSVPSSWTEFVKDWLHRQGLRGEFAMLTQRTPFDDPAGNHRM